MALYEFVTVDVFTGLPFGGNPLAVFPDARGLSDADMQSLAREFNLSETTFVLPPDDPAHTAKVRIFNPSHEMPFAGHPNVGTGYVLAGRGHDRGGVMWFEERAGLVEIQVQRGPDGAVRGAAITAPQPLSVSPAFPARMVAACAGLHVEDVRLVAHPPMLASVGNPFVIAEVAPEALSWSAPDLAAARQAASEFPTLQGRLGLYLYARRPGPKSSGANMSSIQARMFAPLSGTWEDPATGSAATALAALLLSLTGEAEHHYAVAQGIEMGRPSLLQATARRTPDGIRASVAGECVAMLRGEASV